MTKKDLLSIPQITPDFRFGSNGSVVPADSEDRDTESSNHRNITSTSNQQMSNMDAYAKKAIHAVAKMTEITNHSTEQYYETIEDISDLQSKSQGKVHETIMLIIKKIRR